MSIISFNATKCKHCYKCVRYCDVKAVMIKDERAEIMDDHCILCGHCLTVCPQEAKTLSSDLAQVKAMIEEGFQVVASIAPSYMAILKYHHLGQVKDALEKLGFCDVRETSEGAAFVTHEYERLIEEGTMDNIITTCCPSANDLIEMYYPDLVKYMAPVVSPMIAHGKLIKHEMGEETKVVFIGPCIAKKKEAQDPRHDQVIDAVLNFKDIENWLEEKKIDITQCEDKAFTAFDPAVNRLYPVTSGIISSVMANDHHDQYHKFYVHDVTNCIDLCESLQKGDIHHCFIEINSCAGGCIKGPAGSNEDISRFKAKLDLEATITRDPVPSAILEKASQGVSFDKAFLDRSLKDALPSQEEITEILHKTGKYRPEDQLNCGACGDPTCRDKAIAVYQHKAELEMCIPFMHSKAESLSNLVMETSPNAVIMVDKDMKIIEFSQRSSEFFGVPRSQALKKYLYEIMPTENVEKVFETHRPLHNKQVSYDNHDLDTTQTIVYIPSEDSVLMTITDISREIKEAKEEYEKKLETVDLAQKVIHKQMMVAQEIAGLLGETTAETKTTLTKLCKSLLDENQENRS